MNVKDGFAERIVYLIDDGVSDYQSKGGPLGFYVSCLSSITDSSGAVSKPI